MDTPTHAPSAQRPVVQISRPFVSLRVLAALALALLILAAWPVLAAKPAQTAKHAQQSPKSMPQAVELLSSTTADLPEMQQRGQVRVLVVPNRTNFTMAPDGSFRGLEHDLARLLQRSLNKGRKKHEPKIAVVFVPVLLDELLPALLEGRGDIAAAGLTITPAREARVAFSLPYIQNVREVLVTRQGTPPVTNRDDLSGRVIHVAPGSSHAEHLELLRQDFARRGLPPMTIVEADHVLDVENLLEMLSAGMLENVVADEHIARLWAKVLPGLAIYPQREALDGGRIAWAVRKDNPLLLAAVNTALRDNAKKQTALFQRSFPASQVDAKRLENPFLASKHAQLLPDFRRRSDEYGFDWLHMLAQGFQESGLNNNAKSPTGAIGVMQVLPSTGASLGFRDIRPAPENIHAGVRYMSQLRDKEINADALDPEQRFYFSLAAYNAGPARIRKLREQTRAEGLDPNVWFGSVERVALRNGLQGPVMYVRNIRAYYIAYSLSYDIHQRRTKAHER